MTKIEFKDVKADKVLWQNPYLAFREDYEVSNTSNVTDPAAFLGQDVNALDRLAVELARTHRQRHPRGVLDELLNANADAECG